MYIKKKLKLKRINLYTYNNSYKFYQYILGHFMKNYIIQKIKKSDQFINIKYCYLFFMKSKRFILMFLNIN